MGVDLVRALSFGARAESYDRLRPGYPPEAVDLLLGEGRLRVADVGAGTGKLTTALLPRAAHVVAIEPDAGMRSVLERRIGADQVRDGAAERLPLDDNSVDLVVFAQSWHWAEQASAAAEACRVLAPGGVLAMMWNHRDDQVEWVRDLLRAEDPHADPAEPEYLPTLAGFGRGTERIFHWADTRTTDECLDLVCTHSSIAVLDGPARATRLEAIRDVLRLQQRSQEAELTIPQRCAVWTYALE